MAAGKKTESDLADDVKQFDVLLAEHQGEKTDAVARILYMKATLYDEVFITNGQGRRAHQQLKTDFKGTDLSPRWKNVKPQEAAAREDTGRAGRRNAFSRTSMKRMWQASRFHRQPQRQGGDG